MEIRPATNLNREEILKSYPKRDILFRGKRTDNNNWIYGFLIKESNENFKIIVPSCRKDLIKKNKCTSGTYAVFPDTVGQYINLDDIKGNKIFENDIVKCQIIDIVPNPDSKKKKWVEKESYEKYVAVYDQVELGFMFEGMDKKLCQLIACELEIIGNVFDNSKLLESELSLDQEIDITD